MACGFLLTQDWWDIVFKIDDDVFVDINNFKKYLGIYKKGNYDLMGQFWDDIYPIKDQHMVGVGYFANKDFIKFISEIEIPRTWENRNFWKGL